MWGFYPERMNSPIFNPYSDPAKRWYLVWREGVVYLDHGWMPEISIGWWWWVKKIADRSPTSRVCHACLCSDKLISINSLSNNWTDQGRKEIMHTFFAKRPRIDLLSCIKCTYLTIPFPCIHAVQVAKSLYFPHSTGSKLKMCTVFE